jgi:hypothetical protein
MSISVPAGPVDLDAELVEAERQAWNALAHGKYAMFGYWAAWVVKLRAITGKSNTPSPFRSLVETARAHPAPCSGDADVPIMADPSQEEVSRT